MLIIRETFNQRKAFLWSFLHGCQELLIVLNRVKGDNKRLALEVAKSERVIIKQTYEELKELQRWFKTSGLGPDEPYKPPGMIKAEARLTDEEWDIKINKAHILDQMIEKYRLEQV